VSDVDFVEGVDSRTFEDVEVSEIQLKLSFIRLLHEWSNVIGLSDSGTLTELTELLSFSCTFVWQFFSLPCVFLMHEVALT
jgi:hypothetical protein